MNGRNDAQHQRTTIGGWLGHVANEVVVGLDALTRVQFDRPWERVERRKAEHRDPVAAKEPSNGPH